MLHIHPKVVKTFRTLLVDDIFLCLFLKGENKLPVSLGTDNKIQNRILFFPYPAIQSVIFFQYENSAMKNFGHSYPASSN
ncbi:MAG: hypothetical protein D3905_11800 [Candidatus Electrothrix sp. AS4_5]|nr:hypothetical protein [Candidatus Electrothrix gigas]